MYTNSKKICFIRQFYFRAEKVILFARNQLRDLIVLIFAHDVQIQVAHALCKQGCRLISYTADIRLVTIATCYNCPRSPLHVSVPNLLLNPNWLEVVISKSDIRLSRIFSTTFEITLASAMGL